MLKPEDHYPQVKLRQFVVMPNHIHCIIEITVDVNVGVNVRTNVGTANVGSNVLADVGAANGGLNVGANNYSPLPQPSQSQSTSSQQSPSQSSPPIHGTSKTIGSIVRGFKIGVTKWFRKKTGLLSSVLRGKQGRRINNAGFRVC